MNRGRRPQTGARAEAPRTPPFNDPLTRAEWRDVDAVRHGMRNLQMARRLGVSGDAMKYPVANAPHELGLVSRNDLRAWHGLRKHSALTAQPEPTMNPALAHGRTGQVSGTVRETEATASILGFRVEDIRSARRSLAALGVVFAHTPHRIHRPADGTESSMASFHDPDGRPLALMAQVRAAAITTAAAPACRRRSP